MARRKRSALSNPADQNESPIMSLPPELRNRIYHMLFNGLEIDIPKRSKDNRRGGLQAPGILMSCKLIHSEAVGIYYSNVAFSTSWYWDNGSLYRVPQFLKKVGPDRVKLIKHLHVHSPQNSDGGIYDRIYSDYADQACRGIEEVQQKIEETGKGIKLADGVIKSNLRLFRSYDGIIWTSSPHEVAEAHLAALREAGVKTS